MGIEDEKKLYPAPLSLHEDVVCNAALFMETLQHFHNKMGTKFMIPVIGGKELDLHLLYGEVTGRGGFEKVVGEKKWRDVITAFNFPPTTTSASFVLRKYYLSLLFHYEQVYFLRLQGRVVPKPVNTPVKSLQCTAVAASDFTQPGTESTQKLMLKKRESAFSCNGEGECLNSSVVGVIDGKFDHGYLVTVKLGPKILHGVLYHVFPSDFAPMSTEIQDHKVLPLAAAHHGRRRKRRRDPAHPKSNRSAYNFFFAEQHSKLRLQYPQREREFIKMIGEAWNKLSPEERMVYQDWGLKDKERYKREMQEYRERLKPLGVLHEVAEAASSSHGELVELTPQTKTQSQSGMQLALI